MNRLAVALAAIFSVMLLPSCSGGKKSLRDHSGSYLESVKLNYDAGIEAIAAKDYDKAIGYFQFVKGKYPFSKYSSLSDLKIADVKFLQEKWFDASTAYEVFIRLHPRHEEVPYASYRVGVSYFNALPSNFFILPPPTSRDQSFTKEALNAVERFILQYPTSKYVDDAQQKRLLLFSYLAQHNIHIADYYQRRGKHEAALARLVEVESLYPESKESAKALYIAAKILMNDVEDNSRAFEALSIIVEQKKDSEYFEKAQDLLREVVKEGVVSPTD